MSDVQSRRRFIFGLGAVAAVSALPIDALGNLLAPLYPKPYSPIDLSYLENPVTAAPAAIQFGYASITWNGNFGPWLPRDPAALQHPARVRRASAGVEGTARTTSPRNDCAVERWRRYWPRHRG